MSPDIAVDRVAGVSALVSRRLAGFASLMRDHGVPVGAPEVMNAMAVLNVLGLSERDALYWGLRLTMVKRSEHLPVFERTFREYWDGVLDVQGEEPEAEAQAPEAPRAAAPEPDATGQAEGEGAARAGSPATAADDDEGAADELARRAVYSDVEILRKNFADYRPEDEERLLELLANFRVRGPWRRSRRMRRHRKGALDMRRTVRSAFKTEGHPIRRLHQRPRVQHRRLAFVCDVSGSMESYSRAVLHLAHVALANRRRVEAFAFATRLTRVTRELVAPDPNLALRSAAEAVIDWSGGTRVGECLAELNRRHRSALQGAVVVIASDGWDLGDAELLAAEAALLQRIANSVVWVNPHLQDPAFEPLTRGMSAALPYVDHFLSCHNFETFLELMELLDRM